MPRDIETILTLTPTPGRRGTRIARARYEAVRNAILRAVDTAGEVEFRALPECVRRTADPAALAGGSATWYTVCVKQDLEARGILERVPGARPQRLRRPAATREPPRRF